MHSSNHALRLSRRKLLVLLGGSAAGASLLAASGTAFAETEARDRDTVLHAAVAAVLGQSGLAAAQASDQLAGYRQATQTGFSPVNSTLTFGSPTDVAAGWDGTSWAIDEQGAPHVYDPLSDTWQLHGTGLDAAVTSFPWLYPSVYFKGSEVLIADGQHAVQSIATAWPQMPKSYQQGVMGAIAVEGHLDFKFMLFRSGTYLTVPAPPPAQGVAAPPNAPLAPFAVPTSTTPTPVAAGTPHAGTPVVSPTSDAGTAVATPTPRPVAEVYHAAFLAAETTTPSAVPTSRDTPSATVRPSDTPTNAPSPSPTPAAATATASTATTQTPTPASAASQTATPATPTPSTATPTPSTATPTSAASPVPTPSPTPPTDYVARPLNVITGWPQTASWQDGIIDGVYGGTYGAYLIRGGEYVQLGFSRDGDSINIAVSNGPSPVGNLGSFLPNLPAAWQSSGFDTGFDVIGADGRVDHTVITSGAQALVIDRTGSVASPSEMATPKPSSANTTVYHAALIAATTPTPGAAAASATPATTPTRGTTPTATSTATPRPSASPTDAPSLSPTATATPAASETATPAATPTMGDTATPTATPVASETVTPTPTPAASETATPVATETATPTPSASGGQPATIAVAAGLSYIPRALSGWPASWHPQLQHAPNGRSSGLWAATVEGSVVSFDGTAWTQQSGDALSVGVGKDGTVFAVGKNNPKQLSQWDGSAFAPVATHSADLTQVSVGTKAQVWTRDSTNAVHQLNQGQLQPVPLAGSAADIAANHDGTLWSCTGSDPQVQRLASDLNQTPASVAVAGTVQKVASTGFGVAHCLVAQNDTTQLYRYDSPYVFRTPGDYVFPKVAPIEEGLGSLFFVTQSSTYATGAPEPKYQVVALDAQTGQELSRSAIAPPGLLYTPPAFDPVHNVLIVGLTVDTFVQSSVPTGQLLGLDARDLTNVRWSITLPNDTGGDNQPVPVGPGRPTLQGTQLCVSDGTQSLVMYDTGGPDATTPTWRWTQTDLPSGSAKLTPPVISKGSVYAAWWRQPAAGQPDAGNVELWLWKLSADDSSGGFPMLASFPPDAALDLYWDVLADQPPVLATVSGPQAGQSRQVLFVSGGTTVWGIDVDAATAQSYHLPGSGSGAPYVISGFGYADGVLWFGDTDATLYGLDAQTLQPVPNTPATFGPGTIATTPLLYTDAKAEAAVLFSIVNGTEPPGLIVFDPTSGNTISIPTQGTQLVGLGATATNGVVYAGGGTFSDTPDPNNAKQLTAQVFAIRVDQAVQQLRDFVVDSQLMQDFDDPSQPTHDPSGVARYQTQLTLVDSTRAPLANTTVKLWADQPNTTVLVNGQSLTLGPDDDDYAVVATGNDGALVITSGSTQRDSKGAFADGADMTAVPLRAWAHFMDPYERMVIYRDREFHNRVSTAHATDPNQAGADDPTRANIQTAQAYGAVQQGGGNTGTSLFTDQQKQQGQPQNVTNAIQKMTGAVGTAPPKSSKNLKASWSLQSVDTPGKYVVYPDTPGAQYSPVNVAANRPAIVLQTTGLSYTSSNDGAAPLAYNPLSPAEATMAIDALEGQDWLTSVHATPRVKAAAESGTLHLGSWWDDFWNWLKGAAATVTHVIVSVGEEIYLGIRAVVGEIESVFRTIIADIAEVANAIGSFFMQLGRLIEEIIEALSVLFQFGHIIDTHNRLKKELLKRINGDGSAAYPGLTALVLGDKTKNISGAVDHVDNFFNQGEQAISDAINKLADALAGSSVTDLQGGGATAHSTLSATPKSGGASASTATQGTWALNKFNGGIGSSTVTATASRHLLAADDPISAFFNTFAASLSGDGNLTSQWAKVQSGAQGLTNATSPADFIKQGLAELLRVLALLLDGALAVSNAFVDGLLATIASLIQTMFAPDADGNPTSGGILSEPLDFPVLSWLYQLLFGEPLTILNALMLVIAIPVTILWRIVEGQWPSDSLSVGDARRQGEVGDAPALLQRLMSYASAISTACLGFVYAAGDALGESGGPALLGRAALGGSLLVSICSIPTFSSDSPSTYVWASWGLGLGTALLNILSSINFSGEGGTISTIIGSFVLTALSLALTGVMGVQFGEDPPPDLIGKAVLGIDIATQLPGVINTWKLTGEILAVVVAIADVVMGFAGAVATLISALA